MLNVNVIQASNMVITPLALYSRNKRQPHMRPVKLVAFPTAGAGGEHYSRDESEWRES